MSENKKATAPIPAVGAAGEQSKGTLTQDIIPEKAGERNLRKGSLDTLSMSALYDTAYPPKSVIIENLLYAGTYLFAGAPKIGKSFFMAQLSYHIATGTPLWTYAVHPGEVLYLALEDDYARIQKRLFKMFGMDGTDALHFATQSRTLCGGLSDQLDLFMQEHPNTKLIIVDSAKLSVVGRDQQDQELTLEFDQAHYLWKLVKSETEVFKTPPDPVLESVAKLVTLLAPVWSGRPSELTAHLPDVPLLPHVLTRYLNINAERLFNEYGIVFESKRTHDGRLVTLTLKNSPA